MGSSGKQLTPGAKRSHDDASSSGGLTSVRPTVAPRRSESPPRPSVAPSRLTLPPSSVAPPQLQPPPPKPRPSFGGPKRRPQPPTTPARSVACSQPPDSQAPASKEPPSLTIHIWTAGFQSIGDTVEYGRYKAAKELRWNKDAKRLPDGKYDARTYVRTVSPRRVAPMSTTTRTTYGCKLCPSGLLFFPRTYVPRTQALVRTLPADGSRL